VWFHFYCYSKQALFFETSGDYPRAFNHFNLAIGYTENIRAKIKIMERQGLCLFQVGNIAESDDIFLKIINVFKDYPESHLAYAKHLNRTNRSKQSRTYLYQKIKDFPYYLEFYLILASYLKDAERLFEAIQVLKMALSQEMLSKGIGVDRRDIWAELGSLYFDREDYNSSYTALKKSYRLGPEENFLHYELLAESALMLGDYENSILYVDKYYEFNLEQDSELLLLKARAQSLSGLEEEAANTLDELYSIHDSLVLKRSEITDLAILKTNGYLDGLENLIILED
jgi:tetratricopeptide (TPR) repeat protein